MFIPDSRVVISKKEGDFAKIVWLSHKTSTTRYDGNGEEN